MRNFKKLLMALVAATLTVSANAQTVDDEGIRPFISLQGGATRSYLQEGINRKWIPMGALSFGAYFTPAIGARIQANGWKWNQDNTIVGKKTKNLFYGGMVDMMLNLSNISRPRYGKPVNVVLIGGFGLHYAETKFENLPGFNGLTNDKDERVCPNLRGALQVDIKLSHNLALLAEGGYHIVSDHYGVSATKGKAWPYAMAGIAYKFGKKKAKPAPTAANYLMETAENQSANTSAATPVVTEQTEKPQPQPTALGAVEIKKPETTTQNIHFTIGRSAVTAQNKKMLAQTADWVKAHEGATVSLTGYADKGTGNATINQKISRQRVEAVKAELIRQGVNASRITTDAKGDTVQPFAENDQNRVVIAICEEK